jgi:hypothetical protein
MNYEKLKSILMENVEEDDLMEMVSECNSWDGSLEDYRYEYNDEDFFNIFFNSKPYEVARAVSFGSYNYNDEYVRFDVYNNLESFDQFDVERRLRENKEEIIDQYIYLLEQNHVDDGPIYNYLEELGEDVEDEEYTYTYDEETEQMEIYKGSDHVLSVGNITKDEVEESFKEVVASMEEGEE